MGFLQKFGYLEGRQDNNSEALFREEAVIDAIRTMQSFGGINPTGRMDNDTLQVNFRKFLSEIMCHYFQFIYRFNELHFNLNI